MTRKPCQLSTKVFPLALLIVGLLVVACEVGGQQPVSQNELRDLVREEVQDLRNSPGAEWIEIELRSDTSRIRFEVEELRNQIETLQLPSASNSTL